MIFQRVWKKLGKMLPWCLLIFFLTGCGGSLWQTAVFTGEDTGQAQQWMKTGWLSGQNEESFLNGTWRILTGTVPTSVYYQLISGFPVLQNNMEEDRVSYSLEEEAFYASAFVPEGWKHKFEKINGMTVSEEVQVLLYHTHNAETYQPTYGVSKVTGQNGGVVQAAKLFQSVLQQKYGIRTIHNTSLHDYPDWNRSYQNSLATVQQMLQANPDVKAVFDIHRDAGFTSKKATTATVHGKQAARIMLVIGANHENWKENLAFARRLEAVCKELYPGLLRENIHIRETGRYNQQIHPHAVLLEIGSDLNTQEEADYALECFSHVVYEVLKTG